MSNKLSDVIEKLQELEAINQEATVIIPGFEFFSHNVRTVRVKKVLDKHGRQSYGDLEYTPVNFNAVVLVPEEGLSSSKVRLSSPVRFRSNYDQVYDAMNVNNNTHVDQEIADLIKTLDLSEEELPARLIDHFRDNYSQGDHCIYYFDACHYFTSEAALLRVFPGLKQIDAWRELLFKPAEHCVRVSNHGFNYTYDLAGDPNVIQKYLDLVPLPEIPPSFESLAEAGVAPPNAKPIRNSLSEFKDTVMAMVNNGSEFEDIENKDSPRVDLAASARTKTQETVERFRRIAQKKREARQSDDGDNM